MTLQNMKPTGTYWSRTAVSAYPVKPSSTPVADERSGSWLAAKLARDFWISLVVITGFVATYLCAVVSFGVGMSYGDGGYWLLCQRDAFKKLPSPPTGMTPLTDVLGGAWIWATDDLGLYGARLGWAAINVAMAAMVFATLARWFSIRRVAVAILLSVPLICHQQITVLEYNNIPWFLLLSCALIFQYANQKRLPLWWTLTLSVVAGIALGAAVLARFPLLPSIALPAAVWLVGRPVSRDPLLTAACSVAGLATLAIGIGVLWATGAFAETISDFQSLRAIGTAGSSGLGAYSLLGLAIVYVLNTVIGIEQLSVVLLAYGMYLMLRAGLVSRVGSRFLWLSKLPLVIAVVASAVAAVVADGVFNPRFLSGLPFLAATMCVVVFVNPPPFESDTKRSAVQQLCVLAVAIPVLTMMGSNLGFYRMISAGWLMIPLAIVLIPEVSSAVDALVVRLMPQSEIAVRGACKSLLYGVVATLVGFGATLGWQTMAGDGSVRLMSQRSSHPRLHPIRDEPRVVEDLDEALRTVDEITRPGETIVAYPHLEMFYFVTRTRNPFSVMFTHENIRVLTDTLEKNPPRCVVYRDNSANSQWRYSESRRQYMDHFLEEHGYRLVLSNSTYKIFTLPNGM